MSTAKYLAITLILIISGFVSQAQTTIKGKIIDASTKESIYGASVRCTDPDCRCGCITNSSGEFEIHCKASCKNVSVSFIGYNAQTIAIPDLTQTISLTPATSLM